MRRMRDSDVAARIGEEWSGVPSGNEFKAFKVAASTKTFERLLDPTCADAV